MKKIAEFIKKEIVLCAAALLAIISAFFVTPDRQYIDYIDFRTLGILFCLMAVMAGFRRIGLFSLIAEKLLKKVHSTRMVTLILVLLCFVSSMFITNDVALITFVPLTMIVLNMIGKDVGLPMLIPVVIMETIAANLGSMLTPIGNPQNLYLYSISGIDLKSFVMIMLPYSLISLVALIVWIFLKPAKQGSSISIAFDNGSRIESTIKMIVYCALFVLCLLVVARIIPYYIVLGIVVVAVVITDIKVLKNVDYCLLLTFIGFFIFIGNMGRIPQVHDFIQNIVTGREVVTSVVCSQFMSNVPAALLLSGFTENIKGLIVGTNLGGLGTLIASMASLISFKYIGTEKSVSKGKYLLQFTIANIIFLALLLAYYFIVA